MVVCVEAGRADAHAEVEVRVSEVGGGAYGLAVASEGVTVVAIGAGASAVAGLDVAEFPLGAALDTGAEDG